MDLSQKLDAETATELVGELGGELPAEDAGVGEQMFDLGGDERRMHVRAYNHWVSLLHGAPFPAIADLEPRGNADFGDHSVLLDFTGAIEDPVISYLGATLRAECGIVGDPVRVAEVPSRSLLSRLTDHYLQIIANRAPIGFEAEFVNTRGHSTLYRGILMPYSSTGEAIDFIYGVINWKEIADPLVQATLDVELEAAMRDAPSSGSQQKEPWGAAPATAPVWADGPSGVLGDEEAEDDAEPATLDAQLMMARESAAAVRAADTRSRSALYRALGRAHDFALAAERDRETYRRLLDEAGVKEQARAPMTPIAKLVFGADYDKTRLTEFATVLTHATHEGVRAGELPEYLGGLSGGIKAVVAAARAARKPVAKDAPAPAPALADRAAIARVDLPQDAAPGHLVLLVARVGSDGGLEVVAQIDDASLTAKAVRAAA